MRVMVFFDLPVQTTADRRAYTAFRRYLLKSGFLMLQESVYCKLALNGTAVALIKKRVDKNLPGKGSVMMLTVTEKQFEAMDICLGTRDGPVLDSDSTLVII